MWIADLKIENFRGIKAGFVQFSKSSVIIGPNNAGKTTLIEALALLFGRDKMVRTLTEHDFYGSDPQVTDRINILSTITGFAGKKPEDYTDWFGDGRGVPKWYDPKLKKVKPMPTGSDSLLACQIAFSARFDRTVLEVETLRYFYDGDGEFEDVFANEGHVSVPRRVTTELGFFLVPANRSWDRVISFSSELFRRLIAAGGGPPAESVLSARDGLRNPPKPLENDANLSPIIDEINNELSGFFVNGPKLKLRITPTDSEGVLDSVIPHFSQHDVAEAIPSRRHGNGLVSLQWLLLLLQFGRLRAKAGENFIMALEEPELHIPPSLQQKLVHRLQALSSQAIITTHSPTVAAISDPTIVLVIHKEAGILSSKRLLEEPLTGTTPNSIRKLFQLNRTDTVSALMHDLVLVPEGRIDFDMFRLLTRAVDLRQGWVKAETNDFGTAIGIVPTHDGAIVDTYSLLSKLHSRVCCLVDGDKAGKEYVKKLSSILAIKTVILSWPNDWTIEDVLSWILLADDVAALTAINSRLNASFATMPELVNRLKLTDREKGGWKGDNVVYEHVVEVVYENKASNERAQDLLVSIAKTLVGQTSNLFIQQSTINNKVYVFQP
jgi:putative ATP-dependent endonuclease of the OLD family